MPSMAEFARSAKRLSVRITKNVDAGWRATALVVDQTVVTATPVDTGRARSNWRVDTKPSTGQVEPYAPGEAGSTASANTAAAIAQGRQAVQRAVGDELYISNNLDYIGELNAGSSAQAPANFVEAAVDAGVQQVKKIKALG